jgi:hypothetical protein
MVGRWMNNILSIGQGQRVCDALFIVSRALYETFDGEEKKMKKL